MPRGVPCLPGVQQAKSRFLAKEFGKNYKNTGLPVLPSVFCLLICCAVCHSVSTPGKWEIPKFPERAGSAYRISTGIRSQLLTIF
jgi:hypothetical protein